MRIVVHVIVGLLALAIVMLGRGIQMNPNQADQIASLPVHLVGVLLAFMILFFRKCTAIEASTAAGHLKALAVAYLVASLVAILAIISLLFIGSFAGEVGQLIVSRRLGLAGALLILLFGVMTLIAAYGLFARKHWVTVLAKFLAFPISFGWPIGFGLALYTWWVLGPRREAGLPGTTPFRSTR